MKKKNAPALILAEGFTSYLQSKDLAQSSIIHYTMYAQQFMQWIKKEETEIKKADVLNHLEYLKKRKNQQNITRRNHLIAINHYFTYLYQNEAVAVNPCLFLKIRGANKKTLYKTFTAEQLQQLNDNYYHNYIKSYNDQHIPQNQRTRTALSNQRNAPILGLLLYQGTTTKELDTVLIQDLDLQKATIKIQGGKKSNDRTLPLKAEQIGQLMHYLQEIRPQLMAYHENASEKLFLPLPMYSKKTTDSDNLMHVFKPLTKHIKSIEPSFVNFKQIRASVITIWLKMHGLRKAQYLAGHRYISSTESYKPNNLEGLTSDITALHPFA